MEEVFCLRAAGGRQDGDDVAVDEDEHEDEDEDEDEDEHEDIE